MPVKNKKFSESVKMKRLRATSVDPSKLKSAKDVKFEKVKNSEHKSDSRLILKSAQLETTISWSNIQVEIKVKGKTKRILDNVSGEISNLELMCIIGPSGSGKTTLLNTIVGSIKNYRGSVNFYSKDKRTTFAFVPQTDQLAHHLTVKESLMFSSKLKNQKDTNHSTEVGFVLDAFNLWSVRNQYTSQCSGGERKRLSIGLEMINKPKILILDEMTTGLDSSTSHIIIEVLKKINKNTAILTTIHQPNSSLFQMFDKCYVLAGGKCIYDNYISSSSIVDDLRIRYNICVPEFTNPADFIIEIANDTKTLNGRELIDTLADYELAKKTCKRALDSSDVNNRKKFFYDVTNQNEVELQKIERSSFKHESHFCREFYENVKKIFKCNLRDPLQTIFRLLNSINFPILFVLIMKKLSGKESGCAFLALNTTHILPENSYDRYARLSSGVQDSCSSLVNLVFTFHSAMMPATIVLSQQIKLLRKEYLNSYYSLHSFFWALIATNLIFSLIYSTANSISFFTFTHYEYTFNRFILFWANIFLTNILGDLFGLFLSICWPEEANKIAVLVAGGAINFAMQLWCGFFIKIKTMRSFTKKATEFIYTRHSFEMMMKTLYGDRCKIADSLILNYTDLKNFVEIYNSANDVKLENFYETPTKVSGVLKELAWNKSSVLEFLVSVNSLDDDAAKKLADFWDNKTNLILNAFDLPNSKFQENFLVLLMTIILLLKLCYIMMIFKLRR